MQRCNVTVRLNGDLNNTVRKSGVSPAEIVILRALHGGDDAVVDIQPTQMDKMPHAQERGRLIYVYGLDIVEKVFPGQFAKLPVTLKEITNGQDDEEESDQEGEIDEEDEKIPSQGTAERMKPVDPAPVEDDLTPDDKAVIAMIQEAKSKGELLAIADENEVSRASLPDKVPDIRVALIRALFPMYKME